MTEFNKAQFNEAQKRAINFKDGALLVLACAGSGKTTVIVNRTKKLIESGVKGENILVTTFTKAAAKEMEIRANKLIENNDVTFSTVNALGLKIVLRRGDYDVDNVLVGHKSRSLMIKFLEKDKYETKDIEKTADSFLRAISLIKTTDLSVEDIAKKVRLDAESIKSFHTQYINYYQENNLLDYDDMQLEAINILEKYETERKFWQNKFQYIMVDESQDLNSMQKELLYALCETGNLCFVGDDDQSLYSFRGSNPEIMFEFQKEYVPEVITLGTNYRSGKNIVNTARLVVEENNNRFNKNFKADKNGGDIDIKIFGNFGEQEKFVAANIQKQHEQGVSYDEMAILYRRNKESMAMIVELMKLGIPFHSTGENIYNVYSHWIYELVQDYYYLAHGDKDFERVKRALQCPSRKIKHGALECQTEDEMRRWAENNGYDYISKTLDIFWEDIEKMSKVKDSDFYNYLLNIYNLKQGLVDRANFKKVAPNVYLDILDMLTEQKEQGNYKTMEDWFEKAEEQTKQIKKELLKDDGVKLFTFHGSKGLEFDEVYILNLTKGNCPLVDLNTMEVENIEEERRMFYVAMTRAKTKLYLCSPQQTIKERALCKSAFLIDVENILKTGSVSQECIQNCGNGKIILGYDYHNSRTDCREALSFAEMEAVNQTLENRADNRCEICGRHQHLDMFEEWIYDNETHTEKAKSMIYICPDCKRVKMMNTLNEKDKNVAKDWFCKVNGVSGRKFVEYDRAKKEEYDIWNKNYSKVKTDLNKNMLKDLVGDTPTVFRADKTYLNCPFSDKEEVKSLGGKWDKIKRKWYVPKNRPLKDFKKWIA